MNSVEHDVKCNNQIKIDREDEKKERVRQRGKWGSFLYPNLTYRKLWHENTESSLVIRKIGK